jgi:hypothetical protein
MTNCTFGSTVGAMQFHTFDRSWGFPNIAMDSTATTSQSATSKTRSVHLSTLKEGDFFSNFKDWDDDENWLVGKDGLITLVSRGKHGGFIKTCKPDRMVWVKDDPLQFEVHFDELKVGDRFRWARQPVAIWVKSSATQMECGCTCEATSIPEGKVLISCPNKKVPFGNLNVGDRFVTDLQKHLYTKVSEGWGESSHGATIGTFDWMVYPFDVAKPQTKEPEMAFVMNPTKLPEGAVRFADLKVGQKFKSMAGLVTWKKISDIEATTFLSPPSTFRLSDTVFPKTPLRKFFRTPVIRTTQVTLSAIGVAFLAWIGIDYDAGLWERFMGIVDHTVTIVVAISTVVGGMWIWGDLGGDITDLMDRHFFDKD